MEKEEKNLPSFSYKRMAPEGFTGTQHHLALLLLAALLFGACLCSAQTGTTGAEVIYTKQAHKRQQLSASSHLT